MHPGINILKTAATPNRIQLPKHLIFLATFRCNARCEHCYFWQDIHSPIKNELTVDEIKKMISTLGPLEDYSISGGEPFARIDLPEIVEAFAVLNPRSVNIPTNAFLTEVVIKQTKKILEKVKHEVVLAISVDGLKDFHEKLRKVPGGFDSLLKTVDELKKIRKEYSNFNYKVTTVITNQNIHDMEKIVDFVYERLEPAGHSFELVRGKPKDISILLPSVKELNDFKKVLKKTSKIYDFGIKGLRGKMVLGLKEVLYDYYVQDIIQQHHGLPCVAGNLVGVIYPDGSVRGCELKESLGNLREVGLDFKKVWFSAQADAFRKSAKNCFCTHTCFQLHNVKYSPKMWLKWSKHLL